MSELPEGIPPATEPTPRDSGAGVVLRRVSDGGREVLLGLRSRKASFMAGHLGFPGGGLEEQDRPTEPGAFARCTSREVEEETGVSIAPGAWLPAGERITPPMFPVRFHTHFFVTEVDVGHRVASALPSPQEIEELRMVRPAEALHEWSRGECRIPPPVLSILRTLAEADDAPLAELARRVVATNAQEQRAPRIEFQPDQWVLPVRTATLPPATHTNVWMPGGRRFVIVDPGSTEESENRRLLEVVERRRALGHDADSIVLTHHHRDHVGGCSWLAERLGLPVRAHPKTIELVSACGGSATTTIPTGDGDEIDLDGLVLRALHTPGHAPGHLAFVLIGRDQLIAGDLLSGLSTILIDPNDGDMEVYMASLERSRKLRCRVLLPGHGPPMPGKALDRLIAHRLEREQKISNLLSAPRAELAEIASGAYDDVPQMPLVLTERQTLSHLIVLERRGRARRLDPDGRSWAPV